MKRSVFARATLALLCGAQIVCLNALQASDSQGVASGQTAAVASDSLPVGADSLVADKQGAALALQETANLAAADGDLLAAETSQPPANEANEQPAAKAFTPRQVSTSSSQFSYSPIASVRSER